MTLEWWEYMIIVVSVYLTVYLLNFFLKKINDLRIEQEYNVLYNKTANQYTQFNNSLNLNEECLGPVVKQSDTPLEFHRITGNDIKLELNNRNCLYTRKSLKETLSVTNSRNFKNGLGEKEETDTRNGLNSWIIDLINNNIINGIFSSKA